MKPPQFNLEQVFARATEAWLASNTVGVPESIKHAAPQGSAIGEARSDSLAVAAPISDFITCDKMAYGRPRCAVQCLECLKADTQ